LVFNFILLFARSLARRDAYFKGFPPNSKYFYLQNMAMQILTAFGELTILSLMGPSRLPSLLPTLLI
jgi:hypothetical protein